MKSTSRIQHYLPGAVGGMHRAAAAGLQLRPKMAPSTVARWLRSSLGLLAHTSARPAGVSAQMITYDDVSHEPVVQVTDHVVVSVRD